MGFDNYNYKIVNRCLVQKEEVPDEIIYAAIEFENNWLCNLPGYKEREEERKLGPSVLTEKTLRDAW